MRSEFETLSVERDGDHVLSVTLDRPQVANAINTSMGAEITRLFEGFQLDIAGVRAIVVTGRGEKAFSAGGDLKERQGMPDEAWQAQHAVFERMLRAILACPVPIIAAVNGIAYGGGCEIAAACDFVYAAESARFALPEVTLGIMPGTGGTQTLARAVGERRAMELILTGAPFSAHDALEWGFANRVVPLASLMGTASATARRISANGPIATRQAKQSIRRGLQMSMAEGLAFEIEAYNRLVPTLDRREGVLAFKERRSPKFTGQ